MTDRQTSMKYVRLGNTGLKVSKIVLGCMQYGSQEWQGWVLPEEEAIKQIKAAYDAGINTFNTANSYSNGLSEVVLGKAIKQHNLPREEIVVLTKLFFVVGRGTGLVMLSSPEELDRTGYVNQYGLSRKHIFDSVKKSLERLQLDYVDVLQCHRFDPDTPIPEVMHALHDVVKAGYARYIGMSSCYAWQFAAMQDYAINHNLTPFISMQNHYNLIYREEEREMFPSLKYFNVGALTWSAFARGLLARPLSESSTRGKIDPLLGIYRTETPAVQEIIRRTEEIAKKRGITMAQLSLAWLLNKPCVVAPVIGITSMKQLQDALATLDIQLTEEEMKYLEEPYQPQPISGHV